MVSSGTFVRGRRVRRPGRWFAVAAVTAALTTPGCIATAATDAQGEQAGALRAQTGGTRAPRAIDLGVPGDSSQAQQVGESGVVIGRSWTGDEASRVFRWQDGRAVLLDVPGASRVDPRGVNARGQVLVNVEQDGGSRVVLWEPDGSLTPVSQSGVWSTGNDLNDKGVVAGIVETPEGEQRGVVWQDGRTRDVGDLGVGYAYASDINNRGQVVGSASLPDGSSRGFVWQDGTMTVLPLREGLSWSVGYGINERGDVTGQVSGPGMTGGPQAVIWDRGGTPRDLGGPGTYASLLNNRGVVPGSSPDEATGVARPVTIDRGGVTWLPTTLGGGGDARAMNDQGTVVGYESTDAGTRALAWLRGAPVQLGATPGGSDLVASWAVDVNGRGLVAGSVTLPSGPDDFTNRAVVWDLAPSPGRGGAHG